MFLIYEVILFVRLPNVVLKSVNNQRHGFSPPKDAPHCSDSSNDPRHGFSPPQHECSSNDLRHDDMSLNDLMDMVK